MRQTYGDEPSHSKEMQVKLIGIDLAKNVFQICSVNQAGKVVFNRQRTRENFLAELCKYPEVPIVMEACYSAHYWGRTLQPPGSSGALAAQLWRQDTAAGDH